MFLRLLRGKPFKQVRVQAPRQLAAQRKPVVSSVLKMLVPHQHLPGIAASARRVATIPGGGLVASWLLSLLLLVWLYSSLTRNLLAPSAAPTRPCSTVSSTTLSSVGTGGLDAQKPVTPISGQPPLTGPDGKPEFFYYGAEFCPYCAANRWSMVIALSHFGTFTQLPETLSSSTDTDANTATFTFLGSKYTSSYIDFVPVEAEDRDQKPLQQPTAAQNQLLQTFKITGFPFLDIGNKYQAGALYDPSTLANLSQRDIAARLSNPNDSITRNIVGGANYLTAAICAVTNNQPGSVCNESTIQTIQQSLQPQSNSSPSSGQALATNLSVAYIERRSML